MIGASRRRRDDARDDALSLHRRLAGGEAWHRKLTVASVAALVASAASWLVGAPLGWHAAIVVVAFLIGLAWPIRDATERALAWIADRTGLAYETALDASGADPYGLRAAVVERARASSARLRAPSRQRWWIAVLAVALGLLLLPAAQLVAPVGGTSGAAVPTEAAETAVPEPATDETVVEPERPENPGRATEPEGVEGAPAEGAAEDASPGAGSEQDALSRVMDNLRERDPFQSVDPTDPQDGPPPPAEPREGEQGDPSSGQQQRQGAEPSESEEEGGEPGESSDGAGRSEEGEQDGDQGTPEGGPEEGQQEGTPGPNEGTEDQAPQEGETPSGGDQPGGEDEGQLEPDASSGIGEGPSSIRPTEGAEGESQAPPEFLEGRLEQGPENPGGTVLLPGEDQIDVPPSLRSDGYRRAVEEAVTDGQVPLEYQEIIRNYFR